MRVLVVDDDPDQAIIRCLLLSHYGFETRQAGDPDGAMRTACEYRPEIVLIDLGLPAEHDGLRLIAELQAAYPDVSLVLLTGSNVQRLKDRPELRNVADFLQKGDPCKELLKSLTRIAALRATSPGAIHIQH